MALTVTVAPGASDFNLTVLVQVLTGAAEAGGTSAQNGGATPAESSVTPNFSNSWIAACAKSTGATNYTPATNNTSLVTPGTNNGPYYYGWYSGTVTAGTPVTAGADNTITADAWAIYEVPPSAGSTPSLDASSPALVSNGGTGSVTTASFTPPPGSVLVALSTCGLPGASDTSTISDTAGLTWTKRATFVNNGVAVATVWTATVPIPPGPGTLQPGPAWRRWFRRSQQPAAVPVASPWVIQSTSILPASRSALVFTLGEQPVSAPPSILVASVAYNSFGTITLAAPAGWVRIDDAPDNVNANHADGQATFYRVVQPGDGTSFTFTPSTSTACSGVLYEIGGASTAAPVNQHQNVNVGPTSNPVAGPATPSVPGCLALALFMFDGGHPVTGWSAGWSFDQAAYVPNSSNIVVHGLSRKELIASAGVPVSMTLNLSGNEVGFSELLLIAPAGTPAPVPTDTYAAPGPVWQRQWRRRQPDQSVTAVAGGPQAGAATLAALTVITAPAVIQQEEAGTVLAASSSVTAPVTQLAPATLQPGFAVNSPAAVQLAPATLAAAFTLAGPVSTLDAPATLAAAWSVAAPAVLLAPASLSAAFVITSPNSALAAPASMIITGSLTGSAGQGATLAAGFTISSPAVLLAPATLAAMFTISSPAVQDAPATLAAGLAVAAPDVSLRAPATLSAAVSLAGVPAILAPATMAAQASFTSPAQQLAPASLLAAASLNSPAVVQQAPALLAAGFTVTTLPPPIQGAALLQPGWALTAAGIMIPLQVISGMRAGEPHIAWTAGEPHEAYAAGEPHSAWTAGEPHG